MQIANRLNAASQLSVRLALLLAVVCAVFLMIGSSAEAGTPALPPIEYVVQPGDSLWAIASSFTPDGADVRRLVADIGALSGTNGGRIVPGQVLLIPGG